MPAKRIIILDKVSGPRTAYNVVLWADVPVARQPFYAGSGLTSDWKDASQADISAIRTGAVVEQRIVYSIDGTPTIAAVQTALESRWTDFQTEVTNSNPWGRYGSFWDGAAWTPITVA